MSVLAGQFSLPGMADFSPRYNVAPSQSVAVVRQIADSSARQLAFLKWGLVPSWADDPKIGYRMINARSETVATKPAFRSALKKRRCLIPADGFYEWQKQGKAKQPFHFSMRTGEPFAFAGLWEHWHKGDHTIESCTILTTEANELVAPVHDRMPVILPPTVYDQWLDPTMTQADEVTDFLRPYDPSVMRAVPVSTVVNSPANDLPGCLGPPS